MNGILTCGKRGLTPVLMKKISDIFRLATVVLTAELVQQYIKRKIQEPA